MADVCVVLMTCPTEEKAAELGRAVVEEGLAACANLVPGVRSLYRWEGALCDEREVLVLLKSTAARFPALKARLVALHPSQVPEVLRLDVAAGHLPYLEWVRSSTARPSKPRAGPAGRARNRRSASSRSSGRS